MPNPYILETEQSVRDLLVELANSAPRPAGAGGLDKCAYCYHAERYHTVSMKDGSLMKCKYHSCRHKCKGFKKKGD